MKLYQLFLQHPVICTDSRNCPEGSIFFALKGDNFNANTFAAKAIENGCAYAVVDDKQYAPDERYILVDDVLDALQQLARHHRKQLGTTIIGITGTNGKTTTKELIASVLKEKYNLLYTQGNLNNHIGVPLTLLQLKAEHEMAVVEMGANHPGEIRQLAAIACPDFGIITNVGKAHLEGFGSFDGVKSTKAELYENIFAHGSKVFINEGNEHLQEMVKRSGFVTNERLIPYLLSDKKETNKITGKVNSCSPYLNMICNTDDEFEINTQLIGVYNAENVLAAVTIGNYFGVSNLSIKAGLEKYSPQNNRSQLTITDKNKLVVDAYNANPTSMRAAIINFGQMDVQHKVLILGDMFELGDQSESEHQQIIDLLGKYEFERVILVGARFAATQNTYECYQNADELLAYLQTNKDINNSYVLIKGSRGIKLEKILADL